MALAASSAPTRAIAEVQGQRRSLGTALVAPAVGLVVVINVLPAFVGFYSSLRKIFFFED